VVTGTPKETLSLEQSALQGPEVWGEGGEEVGRGGKFRHLLN
jgi:hypothetical protein